MVAAILRDTLATPLGLDEPELASPRQVQYLIALRGEHAERPWLPELTRGTASAWIRYFLSRRTIAALEVLELRRGDLVLYRRKLYEPRLADIGEEKLREETHVVSSISDCGRVNFKQTHQPSLGLGRAARSAWPTNLALIARPDVAGERGLPAKAAARHVPIGDAVPLRHLELAGGPSQRSLSVLKLWGRALVKLRYDRDFEIVWAPLTRRDLPGCPTEDRDAAEVVAALRTSAPDADVVALLREGIEGVAVTLACSSDGIGELVPTAEVVATGEILQFGLDGNLEAVEAMFIERVRDLQRRRQR